MGAGLSVASCTAESRSRYALASSRKPGRVHTSKGDFLPLWNVRFRGKDMAEERMKGYPKIPRANWFAIRERFKSKPPGEVTASYLASVLNINLPSAKNLIPPLKALGLIGEDNKPTDLAFDWRHDDTYSEACHKMLDATYPEELRDLFTQPDSSAQAVATWFSRHTRSGEAASSQNAAMYLLLLEADLSKKDAPRVRSAAAAEPRVAGRKSAVSKATREKRVAPAPAVEVHAVPADRAGFTDTAPSAKSGFSPKLHVDIQIHISPDSSPEQIDKIFESMAKYLPLKG